MFAFVDPSNDISRVDKCRTWKLRRIFQFGVSPILREPGPLVLFATREKRLIGKEAKKVVFLKPHRGIRRLIRIRNAAVGHALFTAEIVGFGGIADHDETNLDTEILELLFEFTQLRKRFGKERSTDVPQPDNQRGMR